MFDWQVTFQGTVVNIENFLLWKGTFELEVAELRHKKQQKEEEQTLKSKLTGNADVLTFTLFPQGSQLGDLITQTPLGLSCPNTYVPDNVWTCDNVLFSSLGKQLFETDHNLDTSDIQFLEDGK